MARIIIACLLLLAIAGHTHAQTGSRYASIEAFTASQTAKTQSIFTQQQRGFTEPCKTATIKRATAMIVLQEPVFTAVDKFSSGLWNVRYTVDTCGAASSRTVEFKAVSGGVAMRALVPGDTLADSKLQDDVLHSFALATREAMPQCREEPNVRTTTLTIRPKTAADRWQELWVAEMCNRDFAQSIEFLPTKGGTTFKMSVPNKTLKVQKI